MAYTMLTQCACGSMVWETAVLPRVAVSMHFPLPVE
jgi:hypothetical protein